jgi:hypothetical protein
MSRHAQDKPLEGLAQVGAFDALAKLHRYGKALRQRGAGGVPVAVAVAAGNLFERRGMGEHGAGRGAFPAQCLGLGLERRCTEGIERKRHDVLVLEADLLTGARVAMNRLERGAIMFLRVAPEARWRRGDRAQAVAP